LVGLTAIYPQHQCPPSLRRCVAQPPPPPTPQGRQIFIPRALSHSRRLSQIHRARIRVGLDGLGTLSDDARLATKILNSSRRCRSSRSRRTTRTSPASRSSTAVVARARPTVRASECLARVNSSRDRLCSQASDHASQEQVQRAQVPPRRSLLEQGGHLPDRVRSPPGRLRPCRGAVRRTPALRDQPWSHQLDCW
jgi:hypothetical protein